MEDSECKDSMFFHFKRCLINMFYIGVIIALSSQGFSKGYFQKGLSSQGFSQGFSKGYFQKGLSSHGEKTIFNVLKLLVGMEKGHC